MCRRGSFTQPRVFSGSRVCLAVPPGYVCLPSEHTGHSGALGSQWTLQPCSHRGTHHALVCVVSLLSHGEVIVGRGTFCLCLEPETEAPELLLCSLTSAAAEAAALPWWWISNPRNTSRQRQFLLKGKKRFCDRVLEQLKMK